MAKLIQRFSTAMAAGRAAADTPLAVSTLGDNRPKTKKYILALILEQTIEEAMATAATLSKTATEIGASVVLVTDQTSISFYQIENCITEYLPPLEDLTKNRSRGAAETYLMQRFDIMFRKWEPAKTIPFGQRSQAIFESRPR